MYPMIGYASDVILGWLIGLQAHWAQGCNGYGKLWAPIQERGEGAAAHLGPRKRAADRLDSLRRQALKDA